jgi:uncharacterized protein
MAKHAAVFVSIFVIACFVGGLIGFEAFLMLYEPPACEPDVVIKPAGGLDMTFASLEVPAINVDGDGIIATIDVQAMPGSGRVLTNIDNILFWLDTQHSIRTAKIVAQNVTGLDVSDYDLIYTITANASVIEGPSAGSALAIATIAALQDSPINPDVTITGNMDENGVIGSAGGIAEKADAARKAGKKTFLVPSSMSMAGDSERSVSCSSADNMEYCEISYEPHRLDSGEAGISIVKVNDIWEALEHFLA